jgi:hypothetical protein
MGLFKQIAEPLVARNVPVIPLRPRTKIAFLSNWQELATTNEDKIKEWDAEYADANGACVAFAKPGGTWFFEIDKPGFHNEIERETGKQFPTTMTVCSSPGRGHFYFHQTPASIAMGNTQGKDEQGKEAWSARVDNRYVVAPQSYHPTSGKQYEIISSAEIAEAPDWLIEWCIKNQATDIATRVNASPDGPPIPHGSHDNELFRIACMLRNAGMDYEQIRDNLVIVCEKRCTGHGSDYVDMCENKARSACKYKVGSASAVAVIGQSMGLGTAVALAPEVVPPVIKAVPYPVFPYWVMNGTSLYEGFVKPVCEKNSRYPEFMFMPGAVLILNYLGGKVGIAEKKPISGFYMVAIGQKGRVLKSSSIDSAIKYMKVAGIVREPGGNAEGHTIVFQAGSTEGLGMQMTKLSCKNAVLFYDELSTLTSKAGIEGSSMTGHLLTMYGSGHFSNVVKANKETFAFPEGSYTTSLIASTTDKKFLTQWSRMGGGESGLDDRMFFLYQPETFIQEKPQKLVDTLEGSAKTRKLIDQAVMKGMYEIEDDTLLAEGIKKYGNRGADRIEKMALYFAVDLGKDSIDDDCLERAVDVMKYETAVKKYLAVFEATNTEAMIQNHVIQVLQRNSGRLGLRELERSIHPAKYGTSVWTKAFRGLVTGGWITEQGTGVKGDPEVIVLMRVPEEED